MPAITKAFTAIADSAVDPDSPIDTALITGLRDNTTHLREWLGAAYYATAVQDHDHDGANSKSVVLADLSVTTQKLAEGAITPSKLAVNAINVTHIQDSQVTTIKLANASVNQVKLSTGTTSYTNAGIVNPPVITALSGGDYNFFWRYANTSAEMVGWVSEGYYDIDNGDAGLTVPAWPSRSAALGAPASTSSYISFANRADPSGGNSCGWLARYVTASPPYDLGDGDIHRFVYAELDINGKIIGVFSCDDPPWAHNGPTNITPDFVALDGTKFKLARPLVQDFGSLHAARAALPPPEFMRRMREDVMVPVEITQVVKNADMDLIPHPFAQRNLALHLVLLDGVSDSMAEMAAEMAEVGAEGGSPHDFLHRGYVVVDNTPANRKGPKTIPIHSARWKLTP